MLIDTRPIDFHTNVLASSVTPGVPGVKPCTVELTDFNTKEVVDTLEVDAVLVATGRAPYTTGLGLANIGAAVDRRGFVPVNDTMNVLDEAGNALDSVYCIGDANGKLMLAHTASAQVRCCLSHCLSELAVPVLVPRICWGSATESRATASLIH